MTKPDDTNPAHAYLHGLAGRPGAPDAGHAEGARLRAALLNDASAQTGPSPAPDWQGVLAGEAANQASFSRQPLWAGLAAGVAACALGLWMFLPTDESALRGGGGAAAAVWISPHPQADAQALVHELQSLGARVVAEPAGEQAVLLAIEAQAPQREAVNARLAQLDTALDASGAAKVRVQAATSPR